eukprot:s1425_g19.t1
MEKQVGPEEVKSQDRSKAKTSKTSKVTGILVREEVVQPVRNLTREAPKEDHLDDPKNGIRDRPQEASAQKTPRTVVINCANVGTVFCESILVAGTAVLSPVPDDLKSRVIVCPVENKKGTDDFIRDWLVGAGARLKGLIHVKPGIAERRTYLRAAKDAFGRPKVDARETGLPSSPSVKNPSHEKESPVVILQPRSRPLMFGSLKAKSKEYMLYFLESAIDIVGAAATATGHMMGDGSA